jgi:hypothetical protein
MTLLGSFMGSYVYREFRAGDNFQTNSNIVVRSTNESGVRRCVELAFWLGAVEDTLKVLGINCNSD